jgi:hypothetical protein
MTGKSNSNKSTTVTAMIFIGAMTSLLATSAVNLTLIYQDAYAYSGSQSLGQANDCGNGILAFSILCQNCDSQIQGDENSLGMLCEQSTPSVPESEPETAELTVVKLVTCDFVNLPLDLCPSADEFTMNVEGNNPSPSSFPGSSQGTIVTLEPGQYEVTEIAPPTPPGVEFDGGTFSADCTGDINVGESKTCTITNGYTNANG